MEKEEGISNFGLTALGTTATFGATFATGFLATTTGTGGLAAFGFQTGSSTSSSSSLNSKFVASASLGFSCRRLSNDFFFLLYPSMSYMTWNTSSIPSLVSFSTSFLSLLWFHSRCTFSSSSFIGLSPTLQSG